MTAYDAVLISVILLVSMHGMGFRLDGTVCKCDANTVFTVNAVRPEMGAWAIVRKIYPLIIGLLMVVALIEMCTSKGQEASTHS